MSDSTTLRAFMDQCSAEWRRPAFLSRWPLNSIGHKTRRWRQAAARRLYPELRTNEAVYMHFYQGHREREDRILEEKQRLERAVRHYENLSVLGFWRDGGAVARAALCRTKALRHD